MYSLRPRGRQLAGAFDDEINLRIVPHALVIQLPIRSATWNDEEDLSVGQIAAALSLDERTVGKWIY